MGYREAFDASEAVQIRLGGGIVRIVSFRFVSGGGEGWIKDGWWTDYVKWSGEFWGG
jgi:hypothetical protein